MTPRIVILGGGISGLLAAYVLRRHRPILLEAGPRLGGAYTAGGLKYLRQTPLVEKLLRELGVPYAIDAPRGGILLGGDTHPYPSHLLGLDANERERIQRAHWRKTRGTDAGFRHDCLNDPTGEAAAPIVRCDHNELIQQLSHFVTVRTQVVFGARVHHIGEDVVQASGLEHPYSRLVVTLPLGLVADFAAWAGLPRVTCNQLTIHRCRAPALDGREDWDWDYVYTPFHPAISRMVFHDGGSFEVEIPAKPRVSRTVLFYQLVEMLGLRSDALDVSDGITIPGHLPPLDRKPVPPPNWLLLGRYAEWEPRSTAEKVLARATEWANGI